ncbi:4-hydroxyacetophenone monooxygenase [Kribbella sp. VKM Ac-2527]|uniref:4-hydroxyacetophenone monooxygenase n=1 Tax=Kribbella caucasensis TaxID=2512215 RepID=A0A4R6KJU2_9ACTN|nr:NAD(P)/FAD-dependent oxidoreductase [Kribbella sp. VKM Ac-2527]TDO51587.1 4-hydroxyacetophenone monooxygenase [Kribbella sp. VKM Ac-2527]
MPLDNDDIELFEHELAKALPAANIPTLLLLLYQFTGEERWLLPPFTPEASRWDDNDSGGLLSAMQDEVRTAAFEAIVAWKRGGRIAKPLPTAAELIQMMTVSEAQPIPADYAQLMLHKLARYAGETPEPIDLPEGFRVLIIGAGMSGVAAAVRLQQAGVDYTIIEKQDQAGGVWHSHHYPGCGVDTPGHLYSYSFANGDWTMFFPLQTEVESYFQRVAKEAGIEDRVEFGTECLTTRYDEETYTWHSLLRRSDGSEETLVTNAVISAVGGFTTPKWPDIPGLRDFDGPVVHTSKWDPGIELEGKRVAVIGNGASAMQLVPAVADTVRSLTVFQRSRQWAAPFPKFRKPVPDAVRFLLREVPHYQWLYRLRLSWIFDSQVHEALLKDPEWKHPERSINATNEGHREVFTRYIHDQLADRPDLIEKVTPTFPPFGKRMLLDNGWYKALKKPHVTLVDNGVASVAGNKVSSTGGEAHEVDVLIVATGYDVTRFLSPVEVIGRGGTTIREAWDGDDSRAYLGTVVPQFPNLFMLYGPNTALGHGGSFIFTVECQIDFVLSALRQIAQHKLREIECRPEVYDAYNEKIQAMHQKMIWSHPGMSTYFRNSRGRVVTNSPWRLLDYWHLTREAALADFATVPQLDIVDSSHPDVPDDFAYDQVATGPFHFQPGSTSA